MTPVSTADAGTLRPYVPAEPSQLPHPRPANLCSWYNMPNGNEVEQKELFLNGFPLTLSANTFVLNREHAPTPEHAEAVRATFKATWFLRHEGTEMLGVPRVLDAPQLGQASTVQVADHLRFLSYRLAERLNESFPRYTPVRRRPFTFLAQRDEIVNAISVQGARPPLLDTFLIQPRYKVEPRVVELHVGSPFIGLFMGVSTKWSIEASLNQLHAANIDLDGLVLIRRHPAEGERRLVGRIGRFDGRKVHFAEGVEGADDIPVDGLMLEGSRESFARCLPILLRQDGYRRFETAREERTADLLNGPGVAKQLQRFRKYLVDRALPIAPGLTGSVGELIGLRNERHSRCVVHAPPVEYCFDAPRANRNRDPWEGLQEFGPFSRETMSTRSPKVAVLFPEVASGTVEQFLATLRGGISGSKKFRTGMDKVFGFVQTEFRQHRIDTRGAESRAVYKRYQAAVEEFLANGERLPDAAILVVLDEHAHLPDAINPYLHAKALLLMAGVPVQSVRMATMKQKPETLQYSLQNFTIALYAKLHGTPWTVDHDLTINDELVVGIGTCEVSGSRFEKRQRFVGITTVFRGDGNYLLGSLSKECAFDEYPDVLRESTAQVLRDIRQRNGWQKGDVVRVVFHSTRPVRGVHVGDIVAECVRALGTEQTFQFAFVSVSHDHPYELLDLDQRGIPGRDSEDRRKGEMAPERGTIAHIGPHARLVAVTGPALVKRNVAPLPRPLLLSLHRASTFPDMWYLAEQTLKFTSLSWKSKLPVRQPVTIYYSELIAKLLQRLHAVPGWSPALLNVRLRGSRWFL